MQVEVGSTVEGKVTGITHFGAFIAIPGGHTGMVHISEISDSYVKEISDYVSQDEEIKVKVLSVSDDGKISLSIKQCEENQKNDKPQNRESGSGGGGRPPRRRQAQPDVWQPRKAEEDKDLSFEDMMNQFKQTSNDRIGDLKRANEPRRSRRGGGPSR